MILIIIFVKSKSLRTRIQGDPFISFSCKLEPEVKPETVKRRVLFQFGDSKTGRI